MERNPREDHHQNMRPSHNPFEFALAWQRMYSYCGKCSNYCYGFFHFYDTMVFNDSMYLLGNCRRLQLHASTYQEQHLSCVCYDKAVCCALGYKEHLRSLPSNIRVLHLPLPTMTLHTRLQHLVCYTVKIIQITKIYFCYCLLLFALCFISDQHSMYRRHTFVLYV